MKFEKYQCSDCEAVFSRPLYGCCPDCGSAAFNECGVKINHHALDSWRQQQRKAQAYARNTATTEQVTRW